MRKGMVLWGSFLLFWLWAAGARADDFSVLSFSPQGETSGRPEIGLTFSATGAEKVRPISGRPSRAMPSGTGPIGSSSRRAPPWLRRRSTA